MASGWNWGEQIDDEENEGDNEEDVGADGEFQVSICSSFCNYLFYF
jgi:hypothetical protein